MTGPLLRPSARVIVVDVTGTTLLFQIRDPQQAKPPFWITPGGGVNPGEALNDAAARELAEETGKVLDGAELRTPVATCRGESTFRGQQLYCVDTFFGWRTERFEPSKAGWEPLEQEVHAAWRWWSIEELESTTELIVPALLSHVVRSIMRGSDGPTVELPWVAVDAFGSDPASGATPADSAR